MTAQQIAHQANISLTEQSIRQYLDRINQLPEPIRSARLNIHDAQCALQKAIKETYPVGAIITARTGSHTIEAKVLEYSLFPDITDTKIQNTKTGHIRFINPSSPDYQIKIISKP